MRLSEIEEGERVIVKIVKNGNQKVSKYGIMKGGRFIVIKKAPMGGVIVEDVITGQKIMLSKEIAERIEVEVEK